MMTLILEAGFRSLLMALAVWGGIRLLRVQAVIAQKIAWVLVLVAAGAMPLVMHAPFLAVNRALNIPVFGLFAHKQVPSAPSKLITAPLTAAPSTAASTIALNMDATGTPQRQTYKPSRIEKSVSPSAERPSRATQHVASDASPSASSLRTEPIMQALAASPVLTSMQSAMGSVLMQIWSWSKVHAGLLLAIAYGMVGGVLLLRTLMGLCIALRIALRAKPVAEPLSEFIADEDSPLRVRVSADIATPVTIGSSVILPANYQTWDEAKLRIVLAHEQSHVRQKDFYLQLLAAVHAAIFWFSPLGWWLQRKLSELGEALSDRAGLAQASDPASYAQVLLEFAAIPRTTPLAGVAMARTSNLSSRIDRILNDRRFRLDFLGGRRHVALAALLVPAALIAAVALIRIGPAVEAAQSQSRTVASASMAASAAPQTQSQTIAQPANQESGQVTGPDQVTTIDSALTPVPALTPTPAPAPAPVPAVSAVAELEPDAEPEEATPDVEAPEPPDDSELQAPVAPEPPKHGHGFAASYSMGEDGRDSFAILSGNGDTVTMSGRHGSELEKARQKYHTDFIWFERDGKSYVITDPAVVAQSRELFKGDPSLGIRQEQLQKMQAELDKKMQNLKPELINLNSPQFKAQMTKLNAEIAELQKVQIKEISDKVNAEVLSNLQEKMGDLQGQIGEIQGKIGEQQGLIGEQQGKLGEQMGKLGEEMGKIGEQQGKNAEAASRKMKSVIDQAVKDGKAKPVE
ncbi:M56 family metallopeptidase [Acidicapsa ligni]|uniref:M56 family metallopeptidase n=1 Tax=Acidicapsa ligni TaxID=542300 RepID=UPI0021DFD252|nr:M56 family metallopeptidase [Acidicapsa ligni]